MQLGLVLEGDGYGGVVDGVAHRGVAIRVVDSLVLAVGVAGIDAVEQSGAQLLEVACGGIGAKGKLPKAIIGLAVELQGLMGRR